MSSDDLTAFFMHTVSVETYLGKAGNGTELYADPVDVAGFLSRKQRFIRDANGETVVSQAAYSADSADAATLAPKSRVAIPGERPTTIIARQVTSGGTVITGIDRVKVFLQ